MKRIILAFLTLLLVNGLFRKTFIGSILRTKMKPLLILTLISMPRLLKDGYSRIFLFSI